MTASRLAPHHFRNIRAALREMVRITKISGSVAVIDLQGSENQQYDDFNHRLEVLHDPTHVRSYTAGTWRRLFEEAGLVIEKLSERPSGLTVKRWCEIGSSGNTAEREINRLLGKADHQMLNALGISDVDGAFLLRIRTVLIIGRRVV